MLALDDRQLVCIVDAAAVLPVDKRSVFLRVCRFSDADLDDAIRLSLRGLIQESAA
jgi:hypothetical protein